MIEQAPDFSVLMAVYYRDDPGLFARAVESVFANTIIPKELVLVVDGAVDCGLAHLILSLQCRFPVRAVWLARNNGLANALNIGLQHVRTEWVLRADADDFNLPYRFERQVSFIRDNIDLFGAAIREVDRHGQHLSYRAPPCGAREIRQFAKVRNPFNHMTVGFRADFARRCGGYPDIHLKEDYGLWALMLMHGARVANTGDALVEATAGRDMYRRRGGWKYARAEIDLQVHLVRCQIKSVFSACLHGGARALIFLAPGALRAIVYEKLLRYRRPANPGIT